MALAWIFIGATLVVYVSTKSFITLAARCEFMFLVGLLMFFTVHMLNDYGTEEYAKIIKSTSELASLMVVIWLTVLAFDIWWTFR